MMTNSNPIEGYWLVPIGCFAVASVIGWLALLLSTRIERRRQRELNRTRIVSPELSRSVHAAVKGTR
jgi:hypothetical protein